MHRMLLLVAGFAGLLMAPVWAQTKVGDWTVEKRPKDTHCNVSRGYKDKEDDNHDYGIVFTYSMDRIVIVLIYDGWEWEKTGEILEAEFSTDKTDIMKKSKWEVMDKITLRGVFEFNKSILEAMSKAKRLHVDFDDDDDDEDDEDNNSIEIETPRAAEALAALKFCEENRK